jgi:DNA gyrase subunit A
MPIPVPDLRDGLTPWGRQLLLSLWRSGARPKARHLRTVRLIEPIADREPKGAAPKIYATLLRLVRPWVCRYPLVNNQGHVGNIDGDLPAGMRYNEMRLTRWGEAMIGNAESDDPLDGPFPNLLCNGAWAHSGEVTTEVTQDAAADGLGPYPDADWIPTDEWIQGSVLSHIPPHNLGEIARALIHLVEHPRATIDEILEIVQGPDFPTGGTILKEDGLQDLYATGLASLTVRAHATTEPSLRGKKVIVTTELPYGANKTEVIEAIAVRVKSGEYGWISDIRDLSSEKGMRLAIEVRRGYDETKLLKTLLTCPPLERRIEFKLIAGKDPGSRKVSFLDMMDAFIHHRRHSLGLRRGLQGKAALKKELEAWIATSDVRRTRILNASE